MSDKLHNTENTLHDSQEPIPQEHHPEEKAFAQDHYDKSEHKILKIRNVAVAGAVVLFLLSLFHHIPGGNYLKTVAYFLGSGAYFCEILMLTDCFTKRQEFSEMFMAYCFAPLYILLGISYLFH